eukprot:3940736-Amphidinium_carterae.1
MDKPLHRPSAKDSLLLARGWPTTATNASCCGDLEPQSIEARLLQERFAQGASDLAFLLGETKVSDCFKHPGSWSLDEDIDASFKLTGLGSRSPDAIEQAMTGTSRTQAPTQNPNTELITECDIA